MIAKSEELQAKKAEIDKEIKEISTKLQDEASVLCRTQDSVRNECFTLTKKVTQDKVYNFAGFVKASNDNALCLVKYITEQNGKFDISAKKAFEKEYDAFLTWQYDASNKYPNNCYIKFK